MQARLYLYNRLSYSYSCTLRLRIKRVQEINRVAHQEVGVVEKEEPERAEMEVGKKVVGCV